MKFTLFVALFIILDLTSCSKGQSGTKLILDNKIKLSIPGKLHYNQKKFKEESSMESINHNIEYFVNDGSSKEVAFMKLPNMGGNIDLKIIAEMTMKPNASKVFFNNKKTINGIEMYITEFEGLDEGKEKYIKIIYFLLGDNIVMGKFSSPIDEKDSWDRESSEIIQSIKINR